MFSFQGVPLENPQLGWKLIKGTSFFTPFSWASDDVQVPGKDGAISAPSTLGAPVVPVVMYTRKAGLEPLIALWASGPGVITDSIKKRELHVEVLSVTPEGGGAADEHVKVAILVKANGVFWRDVDTVTTDPVALSAPSVVTTAFPGLSAPIRDAIVRVKGQATGLQVTDSRGSFFRFAVDIGAGTYFRFESATGRAFITATDTWTGGAEVTGSIINGPGPYPLQLTPNFVDPANRSARFTVASTARTNATVEVRGRRAYVVV